MYIIIKYGLIIAFKLKKMMMRELDRDKGNYIPNTQYNGIEEKVSKLVWNSFLSLTKVKSNKDGKEKRQSDFNVNSCSLIFLRKFPRQLSRNGGGLVFVLCSK